MQFERARRQAGGEAFLDGLYEDIGAQIDKLPLEHLCQSGGWPLQAKLGTIAVLEETPERLEAVLFISFTETSAACCDEDGVRQSERIGELLMRLDKRDWQASFRPVERQGKSGDCG